jgi:hypothetical protein
MRNHGLAIVACFVFSAAANAQMARGVKAKQETIEQVLKESDAEVQLCGIAFEMAEMSAAAARQYESPKLDTIARAQRAQAEVCGDSTRAVLAKRYQSLRARAGSPAAKAALKEWYAYWDSTWDVLDSSATATRRYEQLVTLAKKVALEVNER